MAKRVRSLEFGVWSESRETKNVNIRTLFCFFLLSSVFFLALSEAHSQEYSPIEARIVQFVRQIYSEDTDVQIKLNSIPKLKEKVKVKDMSLLKIPDLEGEGICLVELEGAGGKGKSVHVPFKVSMKRKLFVLRQQGKRGDVIRERDITIRETYLHGRGAEYPPSIDDVVGRALKKDVAINTIVTCQILEDPVVIKRGEIVDIVAENKEIIVQTKGRTVDKGKMGDMIRVRNMASGKEIQARVTANNAVTVEF